MTNNHVTVLEIDAKALAHNLNYFKQKLQPTTKILAVVKAFGYGSDGVKVAQFLQDKVDYFAVAYAHEGIALREANVKTPILVLHPQIPNLQSIVDYKLEPNLYNFKIFDAFLTLADEIPLMNYPVHIKFNTGLNRLGFWHNDIPKIIESLHKNNHVKVQSLFSHLAASEDLEEKDSDKYMWKDINAACMKAGCSTSQIMKMLSALKGKAIKEEALDEVTKDTDVLEPRSKGEKDFKKMHDDNVEITDEEKNDEENFKNIKKSADARSKFSTLSG